MKLSSLNTRLCFQLAAVTWLVLMGQNCAPMKAAQTLTSVGLSSNSPSSREPTVEQPVLEEPPVPEEQKVILLPLEVMSHTAQTSVGSFEFDLDTSPVPRKIEILCHSCSYRDFSRNPSLGAKVSVRLNEGAWVDLLNKNVEVPGPEQYYGGVTGSWKSVRVRIPLQGFVEGENKVSFRFNGTDGYSTGFRIVDFNVLNQGNQKLLDESLLVEESTQDWEPLLKGAADIEAGRVAWNQRNSLVESPLSPSQLVASCADCHSKKGEDLKYYNFSNWSIRVRSRFHGLSNQKAQQIASYIRSLDSASPASAKPWNPPFQPGVGIDSKPASQWAAGAGLEAVLAKDSEMLPYLFPEGTSYTGILKSTDTRETLNAREMPISLQLPDWNMWLPEVHPLDIWGTQTFNNSPVQKAYEDIISALSGGGANRMRTETSSVQKAELVNLLDRLKISLNGYTEVEGPLPCTHLRVHESAAFKAAGLDKSLIPNRNSIRLNQGEDFCEKALRSIYHWVAVKYWEINRVYELETATADVYPFGEARGFVGSYRQVFDLAPHRIGNDSYHFSHLDSAHSSYLNTAWYQLQVVMNSGNRAPNAHKPPDWKYQFGFLYYSTVDNPGHPQVLRYVQSLMKMWQVLDMRRPNGTPEPASYFPAKFRIDQGPNKDGWWLIHTHPWRLINIGAAFFLNEPGRFSFMNQLNDIEPGLRRKVQSALLHHWNNKVGTYLPKDFPRNLNDAVNSKQNLIDGPQFRPTLGTYGGGEYFSHTPTVANGIYRSLPFLIENDLEKDEILRLIQWGESMWPLADWQRHRNTLN